MTRYVIRRSDGAYLVRDDEFTDSKADACKFDTHADAAAVLEENETIEATTEEQGL